MSSSEDALPDIADNVAAFSHAPEHGFSMFLEQRTKTIHFVRHAEGYHNDANNAYGDETPTTFSTDGAWDYIDAKLTPKGIAQCVEARKNLLHGVNPELVVVSPFTRTLQTAHIMFSGKNYPFLVHDLCRERAGKYTCDKRRSKTEIIGEFDPVYLHTNESIDFESYGFKTENDELWTEEREDSDHATMRGIEMMKWLATRPENEIAVVTHSSWLRHLFSQFGHSLANKDQDKLRRKSGNAEVRSVTLALHKGFYPKGEWIDDTNEFVPAEPSFRRGRWAFSDSQLAKMHEDMKPDLELKSGK